MRKFFVTIFVFASVLVSASSGGFEIVKVEGTPFFPRVENGELLKQIVKISISSNSGSRTVQVRVSVDGNTPYYSEVDTLYSGENIIEAQVLDVQEPTRVKFELIDSSRELLAEKEIIWQPQKKWKVYYAAVSHQDLGFITYWQNLRRANREAGIDIALEYCRETDSWAEDDKFRWNVETSEPLSRWIMKQSPEIVEEFKQRVKEGRIEIAAIHNTISSQMAGYEVFARSFYTPNRYIIDMLDISPAKVAIINDVTGISRSWPLYSKEAQIPYLMHGSNYPNCLNDLYDIPVFYWDSPDGDKINKVLCRTDSYYSPNKIKNWDRDGVFSLIDRHVELEWAYDCILAYDSHDFSIPTLDNARNIKEWNEKYAYPRFRCSTVSTFFDDISQQLISEEVHHTSKDAPDSWDDQDGTDAVLLGKARRVNYEIPSTEKFASIAMALSGGYPEKELFQAYNRTVQYHEHTNGAIHGGNHKYYETERVMHETLIDEAIDYNNRALDMSLNKIEEQIKVKSNSIVIYNPLSWERDEMVYIDPDEIPFNYFSIIDKQSKGALEIQKLQDGRLVFFAEGIPALGYKTYYVKEASKASYSKPEYSSEEYLENDFYKLSIDLEKNIISELFDKQLGKSILDKASPYSLGEYIHYDDLSKEWKTTEFTDINCIKGNLLDEIHISQDCYSTSKVELIIYLHHRTKKIDFKLDIDKLSNGERLIGSWNRKVKEAMFCALPVHVPDFQHHHELAGAVMQPGDKELQFEASESAYYAIQHFADVSNEDYGVSLSTIECPLVEYGYPRPGYWDNGGRKPKEDIEKPENSSMFLYLMNNFFSTNIRVDQPGNKQFTFSINSHDGGWQEGQAYKFAWESSHPILSRYLSKNKKGMLGSEKSFLSVDKDNVICSTMKRAEANGSGYILRFFELAGEKSRVKIKLDLGREITEAYACSLIENDLHELSINENNEIEFEINGHGLKTIRVVSSPEAFGDVEDLEGTSLSDSEIALHWNLDNLDAVSHFNVYRSLDSDCNAVRRNFIGASRGTKYDDKTVLNMGGWPNNRLDEHTKYYYRVAPVDLFNNEGEASEVISCSTLTRERVDSRPVKVQGVYSVHVSPLAPENYINLWFYTNFEKDVDKYLIHRGEEAGFIPNSSNLINVHIPSEHSINFNGTYSGAELNRQMYADETAEVNKEYFYKVCAVDANGHKGQYSDPAKAMMRSVPLTITKKENKNRDFATFRGEARFEVECGIADCEIFYSFEDPLPTRKSRRYTGEFEMSKNSIIHIAVYQAQEENPLFRYSQFEEVSQTIFQSSYGGQYGGDMAIDGAVNSGSEWVSKQYGGGSKESPMDIWLGVNLPKGREIRGIVIAGDDREMMPVQDNFKVKLRLNGVISNVENISIEADSSKKNYYKVEFGEIKSADGMMIYFDKDDLPKSELPGQDGIVRIMELMVITPDGEISHIAQ